MTMINWYQIIPVAASVKRIKLAAHMHWSLDVLPMMIMAMVMVMVMVIVMVMVMKTMMMKKMMMTMLLLHPYQIITVTASVKHIKLFARTHCSSWDNDDGDGDGDGDGDPI